MSSVTIESIDDLFKNQYDLLLLIEELLKKNSIVPSNVPSNILSNRVTIAQFDALSQVVTFPTLDRSESLTIKRQHLKGKFNQNASTLNELLFALKSIMCMKFIRQIIKSKFNLTLACEVETQGDNNVPVKAQLYIDHVDNFLKYNHDVRYCTFLLPKSSISSTSPISPTSPISSFPSATTSVSSISVVPVVPFSVPSVSFVPSKKWKSECLKCGEIYLISYNVLYNEETLKSQNCFCKCGNKHLQIQTCKKHKKSYFVSNLDSKSMCSSCFNEQ